MKKVPKNIKGLEASFCSEMLLSPNIMKLNNIKGVTRKTITHLVSKSLILKNSLNLNLL